MNPINKKKRHYNMLTCLIMSEIPFPRISESRYSADVSIAWIGRGKGGKYSLTWAL